MALPGGIAFVAWLATGAAQAAAQQNRSSQQVDGEIVVTGERVARTLRDTASSIEVTIRSEIEKSPGSDRIEQILEQIPNVQISSGGEGPTIRGQDTTGPTRDLPAFLGGTRPRTTLVVDGRPVGFNEFIFGISPLWDVNRVEVFRSPQTTTQGQNSIAGAIFVETNDPSFSPELRARATGGNFHTRQISLAGSGRLSEDVAVRVAGDLRYSRTSSHMADLAVGADPNHDAYGLLRIKLLSQPGFMPGARFELNYSHSQSQMPQIEGIRPPFERRRDPNATYGVFRTNIDSLTGRAQIPLTGELDVAIVLSGGDSRIQRFAPHGLGETRIKGRDWLAESVFHWSRADTLKATFGASYRKAHLDQFINLSALSGVGRFDDEQIAFGLFGEVTWTPVPGLHLTAGLRYQHDGQKRDGALETTATPIPLNYDRSFHAWLPKLSAAYDLNDDIRVGLLVQKAYNPGGTTLRFDTGNPDLFEDEYLWDYELFARASFAGGKLSTTVNIFNYDLKDAQRARPIAIIAPNSAIVTFADLFNVDRAHSKGGEVSFQWRPNSRLSMNVGVGILDTKITRAGNPYAQYEGREFQRSPHFTASGNVEWRPTALLALSAQVRHNSGYFSEDQNFANRRIEGWTKVDARAAYDCGKVKFFGYVRNIFDDFYLTYLFNPTLATAGDPREFGLGLEARF